MEEVWTNEEGESITIKRSSEISIVAETSLGELHICENCYKLRGKFELMTPGDLRNVHAEFAIEYSDRKLWDKSISSCYEALALGADSEVYFLLGVAYEGAGLKGQAVQSYNRAIELDPENVCARQNLAQLTW